MPLAQPDNEGLSQENPVKTAKHLLTSIICFYTTIAFSTSLHAKKDTPGLTIKFPNKS